MSTPTEEGRLPEDAAKAELRYEDDGETHINVWSQGKTELGKLLSNFAHTPFTHPKHGTFASMEAYWYWCGSGRTQDFLRRLYGASAKSAGVKCEQVPIPDSEFHEMIIEGFRCKLKQNQRLLNLLIASTLPLVHYFVYGGKTVRIPKHDWQMKAWEALRDEFKDREHKKQRIHTKEEIMGQGYRLADFIHQGEQPQPAILQQYAQNLGWPVEETIPIRLAANAWAITRKLDDNEGLSQEEWNAVTKSMMEDVAAEFKANPEMLERCRTAKELSQSLPTDEPRPSTPEEAGVVETPYEVKWDNG